MTGKKPRIVLLVAAETSASVLYGLYDVLMSAGAVYPDMVNGAPGDELLDVLIASADGKPFHCIGNIPVEPHCSIAEIDTADAVIVCDMYTSIYDVPSGRYPREISWLKRMHSNGALLTSPSAQARFCSLNPGYLMGTKRPLIGRIAICFSGTFQRSRSSMNRCFAFRPRLTGS